MKTEKPQQSACILTPKAMPFSIFIGKSKYVPSTASSQLWVQVMRRR